MGTSLTGVKIKDSYDSLLKVTDNGPLDGTLQTITDGLGNNSSLSLSTAGASVTGTLAVSGNAAFDTNTLFVDASTNRVGIGGTPGAKLDIKGESAGGSVEMFIQNISGSALNNSADIYFGTWGGSSISGITNARISAVNVNAGNAETNLDFYTYNGSTSGKRVSITSNGLTFNGDTSSANALDDYEEGTWTMSIAFGGASVGQTYVQNTGLYTKIGRQVTVIGTCFLSNKGTSTGNAALAGLPFTNAAAAGNYSAVSIWMNDITYANRVQGYVQINSQLIGISELTEAGVYSPLTNADFVNDSEFMVMATYFV